jgi:hypothetical protein
MPSAKSRSIGLAVVLFIVGILVGAILTEVIDDEDEGALSLNDPYQPAINPADFVMGVNNTYFPLVPGTTFVYEGAEHVEVHVTNATRIVMGVVCTVVRDTVSEDGAVVEDTYDWYAQDVHGNVWYFGEDSREYEDGKLKGTAGSWEAGVDGALPGIIMFGHPLAGVTYRQEYLKGEAEDMGAVLSLNATATVPLGTFHGVLRTKDFTPLEPGVLEHKYYAPGVGLVLEEEGSSRVELTEVRTAQPD